MKIYQYNELFQVENDNSIIVFAKKNTGGQKIKGTHFIGVRVGCLKIIRNSDKNFFFYSIKLIP